MHCHQYYKDEQKYKDYRNRYKRKYHERNDFSNAASLGRHYTKEEREIIMKHEIPDREIAAMLERSIRAIQGMRFKIKKHDESRGLRVCN